MREVQEKRHRETKRDEGSGTETQVNPERERSGSKQRPG